MGVKLQSALGGSVELNAPSTASNFTMTVPAGNGTVATTDQLQNFRNRVINGDMRIAQRATSATAPGEAYATVDRMRMRVSAPGGTHNQEQRTDGPTAALPYCIRFTQAGSTATLTGNWYGLRYSIEKSDSLIFASSNSATLSFWYRSNRTGSHTWAIDLGNTFTGTGHQTNGKFTVNAANTWEYKTVTINYTVTANNSGVGQNSVGALLTIGPNVERTDVLTSFAAGDYFDVAGLQFEAGSVATAFEHRPYQTELALCQRYYVETTPFSFSFDYPMNGGGYWAGNSYRPVKWFALPVQMRVDPSTTVSYSSSGWTAAETTGASSTQGTWGNRTVYWMVPPNSTGGGNPYVYGISWKCSAEL